MLGSLIAGSLVSAVMVVLARPSRGQASEITIRGPSTLRRARLARRHGIGVYAMRGQNLAKRTF